MFIIIQLEPTYKNLLDFAWLLVLIFLGIKVASYCQQVLKPLGSYTRVFTVSHIDYHDIDYH